MAIERFIPMEYHIRQSNLIEGIDDPVEDARSLRAWNWLMKQPHITPSVILMLHRKITLGQLSKKESGNFRTIQVYVGNHIPPNWSVVSQLVYNWCALLLNEWNHLNPEGMHVDFETIHPFVDGNGRTGRMLMWWHEIKQGSKPTLIEAEDRQFYYEWFKR